MHEYIIYAGVEFAGAAEIGPYSLIGVPPKGVVVGEVATQIGADVLLRSHTVIYAGNTIGSQFQTGHGVMIRENNKIGNNVSVGTHSIVEHHVVIGNGVRLHSNVFVPEYSVLEDRCWLGPAVVLTNATYPQSHNVKNSLIGPTIREGAILGAGVVVLPGVEIGRNALIGAGAVVVRDVPESAVVVGNPGYIIKYISNIPEYSD